MSISFLGLSKASKLRTRKLLRWRCTTWSSLSLTKSWRCWLLLLLIHLAHRIHIRINAELWWKSTTTTLSKWVVIDSILDHWWLSKLVLVLHRWCLVTSWEEASTRIITREHACSTITKTRYWSSLIIAKRILPLYISHIQSRIITEHTSLILLTKLRILTKWIWCLWWLRLWLLGLLLSSRAESCRCFIGLTTKSSSKDFALGLILLWIRLSNLTQISLTKRPSILLREIGAKKTCSSIFSFAETTLEWFLLPWSRCISWILTKSLCGICLLLKGKRWWSLWKLLIFILWIFKWSHILEARYRFWFFLFLQIKWWNTFLIQRCNHWC